ncbi:MAG: glycosyltransferase [bacterium]
MKILFFDPYNIQNIPYCLVSFLRKKGIDAELLFDVNAEIKGGDLPNANDPLLRSKADYSFWIHQKVISSSILKNPFSLIEIINFLKGYELIVCSGFAPIFAYWAKKPFIFLSYGSDLDQLATQGWSGDPKRYLNYKRRLLSFFIKHSLRAALKKASFVLILPHQIETAKRLGLKRLRCYQHIMDTTIFKPMEGLERKREKERIKKDLDCSLLIFHPTRQCWKDKDIKDCKDNDKLFKAFARFLVSTKTNAKLIAIEKGWDLEESKRLVEGLGIGENVIWMAPMERFKLGFYYNVADIVADQFNVGAFGIATVESMACGTPVFAYFNPEYKDFFYGGLPPVVNTKTEDDIFLKLCELATDEKLRVRIGKDSYDWIIKYTDWEVACNRYIELFKEALSK